MGSEKYVSIWRDKGEFGYVSPVHNGATENAAYLRITEIAEKLTHSGYYDIGGTYNVNNQQSEFWFYYTTVRSHGTNYLLNLFVLPRKPACFTVSVPKSKQLTSPITVDEKKHVLLYGPEIKATYTTAQKDEHVYLKTYAFSLEDTEALDKCVFFIPVTIEIHSKVKLSHDVIQRIKLCHNLSSLMNNKETTDLFLESNTKKKYPVHRILLAAHSPTLRSLLFKNTEVLPLDISDDTMEMMLEFLYTGTLLNLQKFNCSTILETAEKFGLPNMFLLAQKLLENEINTHNAISIAVQAKKYQLTSLTNKVFDFIKKNPEVLTTEEWTNIEDIQLVKDLLKHIHPKSSTY